jgi:hypothetical protein
MKLTPEVLREICQQHKQYISCPELNDVLYLNHKGIEKIESLEVRAQAYAYHTHVRHFNSRLATLSASSPASHGTIQYKHTVASILGCCLSRAPQLTVLNCHLHPTALGSAHAFPPVVPQAYTGLRTLYLESNAIATIEGLSAQQHLRTLHLGKNLLDSLHGLQTLTQLEVLDVSHNRISSCAGLGALKSLRSLDISCNRLSTAADLAELQSCTRLVTLDMSQNQLCADGLLELLGEGRWQLALLRLQGNPLVGQIE